MAESVAIRSSTPGSLLNLFPKMKKARSHERQTVGQTRTSGYDSRGMGEAMPELGHSSTGDLVFSASKMARFPIKRKPTGLGDRSRPSNFPVFALARQSSPAHPSVWTTWQTQNLVFTTSRNLSCCAPGTQLSFFPLSFFPLSRNTCCEGNNRVWMIL